MLKFAAITPHPPIIIPTIGSRQDLPKISQTIKSMRELAEVFIKSQPETVIVISPHGPIDYQEMTIVMSPKLSGGFQSFGDYETKLIFENDLEIVTLLHEKIEGAKIPVRLVDEPQLDHGVLVPLYYLTKNYEKPLKVVPIAYSFLDAKTHLEFGKKIFEVCKTINKNIAIVASGDLSHRLTLDAPAGFSFEGAEFDEKLIQFLNNNDTNGILNMDPGLIKEAGECGYLSIITLLGGLNATKKVNFKFLSYECPFGVGYLVGYFLL